MGTWGLDEPIIKVESERLQMPARGKRRTGSALRRWLKRGFMLVVLLALVPAVLILLYLPPFVHPVSTLMIKDLVTFNGYDRRWVSIDDVAPVLVNSVMMSEDGQFCSHYGIDLGELNAVIDDALAGEEVRGASTIPMQTVKNLFLWNGRWIVRKLIELPLAVYYDLVTPKRRIMETYLNIAEWGPGIYGIEAAAQNHFGIPASKLGRRQAALLAVTLPNPLERDPAHPSRGMQRLANIIEKRAARAGGYDGCLR
jgi:monofunctional biosynthetic peptidoglycan transglycosylase